MRTVSTRVHGLRPVGWIAAAVYACASFTASAASGAGHVRFAIEGVGAGSFADARLAANPGAPEETPNPLCLTLAGGSTDNSSALLEWVKSNSAGGALASRPDATLTVLSNRDGLKKGVYRLTDVTVRQFRLKADRDLSDPRLEGAEINCGSVSVALDPNGRPG